jgi:hypothetical protein
VIGGLSLKSTKRVTPQMKAALVKAAAKDHRTVQLLLEKVVSDYLSHLITTCSEGVRRLVYPAA